MQTGFSQNYLDFWGFGRAPFALTPDPDMLYLSKQHRECMLRLQYAIAGNKGGALLVSENPGDGKTSVLRRLEQDLRSSTEEKYRIVFIDHPTLTSNQMLWEILRQLGLGESKGEKIQNLLQLREALVEMYEKGERCVFILDEGQLLAERSELLQEFRVLLNYTVGETFLLTLIFSGQSELEATMKRLPEFYQRLPVRYFLHSMDMADTGRMLQYRIKVAGYEGPTLYTEEAVKEIYRYSRGIPRVICSVADLALVVGHSRGVRRLADREVLMAIRDLDRSTQDGYHYYHFLRSAGAPTKEEEREITEAEAALDSEAAEEALQRLEASEVGVYRLAAEIESWSPEDKEESELIDRPQETEATAAEETVPEFPVAEEEELEEEEWEVVEEEELVEEVPEEADTIEVVEEVEEIEPDLEESEDLVHCPTCGTRQLSQRRTCVQCGAPLHWICPACQHKNPAQRTRCDKCGQSLSRAVSEADMVLRETVTSSVVGATWGIVSAPDFSLKLGEGEKILVVIKNKPVFGKGVKVRARIRAWGNRDHKVDLVVTNHRIHVVARELQSRIHYHEIQGLRAIKGKVHLFHGEGSIRVEYPTGDSEVYSLIHAMIDYLEFQSGRFRL